MDKRVIKTKREIRKAFVTLVSKKEWEKITVKEIAELAEVDRKTVYNYYNGVGEILEELENELLQSFERAAEKFVGELDEPKAVFGAIVYFIKENFEICNLLLRGTSNARLINKMIDFLRTKIRGIIEQNLQYPSEKIDLTVEFVTAGMFNAYRSWFLSENKKPLEEFSKELAELCLFGVPAFLLK